MDDYEQRIAAILGDDDEQTAENIERFRQHLIKNLNLPVLVTGDEDFPWEEPYVMGGWSQKEYEKLKKTNPSYTDTFELESLSPVEEDEDEIMGIVRRVSDKKRFEVGLSWLVAKDENSDAYKLIKDYGIWFVNY